MGQKVHPKGFRLFNRKDWLSNWFGEGEEYRNSLKGDWEIRQFLSRRSVSEGMSKVEIHRTKGDEIKVIIHTGRPGLVIGKKGAEIDALKRDLSRLTQKTVWIEVEEVKRPDLDAKIVADGIARQLERRIPFRRALKKAIQLAMSAGAKGVKVQASGRLGGAEIARTEWYIEGSNPLQTLRANIDYATGRAKTTYGIIGVKVWINRGNEKG